MKATESFKNTIQGYLENRAKTDELFAPKYANPAKNIDDCVTYILNWVKKSGCNGFTDDEIYGQAVHYYDEEKIDIGKPVNCKVVVNHTPEAPELTEEDIQQAKKLAMENEIAKQQELLRKKPVKKVKPDVQQLPSLFDEV